MRARRRDAGAAELGAQLDALASSTDVRARLAADPLSFVHRYVDPHDREVVGLLASSLAFGNVTAIRASIQRALDALTAGDAAASPAACLDAASDAQLRARLEGFVHRVYRGEDLAVLLGRARDLRRAHGSIGRAFASWASDHEDIVEAMAQLADALRGPPPHRRGLAHLMPDPRAGSACKRLCLYLRWMCRPDDGVDLGVWPVDPSRLVIPVDTHVHRIGQNLALTRRTDASMRTAREITLALARFDPGDPVRYDFAICHLGVSRDCPSRRDPEKCGRCVLQRVCVHWRRRDQRR